MLANVWPRQSVSFAISWSMRPDGFIGSLCLEFRSRFMRPQYNVATTLLNETQAARAVGRACVPEKITAAKMKLDRSQIGEGLRRAWGRRNYSVFGCLTQLPSEAHRARGVRLVGL
jgi:hypothetical protein